MRSLAAFSAGGSQMDVTYHPIGIIHSPFKSLEAMPIQPVGETSGHALSKFSRRWWRASRTSMAFPI